jgi:hypothetical protein
MGRHGRRYVDTDNEDPEPFEDEYKIPDKYPYARVQKLHNECVRFQLPQTRASNNGRLSVVHLMMQGRLSNHVRKYVMRMNEEFKLRTNN